MILPSLPALPAPSFVELKHAAIGVLVFGTALLSFLALRRPDTMTSRAIQRYLSFLERGFANMFLRVDPRPILVGQALGVYALVALAVAYHDAQVLAGVPIVVALPAGVLDLLRKRRLAKLEEQADAFILALASALHSTPNIGDAFASVESVVSEPMRSEIQLAAKHMRLGSTLEEALLAMGARIKSRVLDTALTTILIGQRLGGSVPTTLSNVGAAMREIQRIERMCKVRMGAMRRNQVIMATIPIVLVYTLEKTAPGFFQPLMDHPYGYVIAGGAIALWFVALILGRKFMQVQV